MKYAVVKFVGVLFLLALLATAISFTKNEGWLTAWFLLFIFLGLPLLILTAVDLAHTTRSAPNPSRLVLLLGYLLAVPQALFALLTAAIGVAIIGWVLYNTFVQRRPEYTGGFLTFGLGPVMVLFGVGWFIESATIINELSTLTDVSLLVMGRECAKWNQSMVGVWVERHFTSAVDQSFGCPGAA